MIEVTSLANKLGVFGGRGCGATVSGRNRSLWGAGAPQRNRGRWCALTFDVYTDWSWSIGTCKGCSFGDVTISFYKVVF